MNHSAINHLAALKHRYPKLWDVHDGFVREKGNPEIGDWPQWCYCPMAAAYSIVDYYRKKVSVAEAGDIALIAALAPWRLSKGIYRFDSDIAGSIVQTELDGEIPADVLLRLPEWCVYIEMPPGLCAGKLEISGFFAHLEFDINTQKTELRLALDGGALMPLLAVAIEIGPSMTLKEGIEAIVKSSASRIQKIDSKMESSLLPGEASDVLSQMIAPLVSLVLYLCSRNAQIVDSRTQSVIESIPRPEPKKVKGGPRFFAPEKPRVFEVAFETGRHLRQWQKSAEHETGAGPRPHIRRAHWHTFWEGPRNDPKQRSTSIKWLPPIPVNFDAEEESLAKIVHVS